MLDRLSHAPEASVFVIGGGVALNCYIEPRPTHDVDAWWAQGTRLADRSATVDRIRAIAREVAKKVDLSVSERTPSANDVISIELQAGRRAVFSFQVAPRDVELQAPIVDQSPFSPIPLETLADNLGAKMTALVNRGAPRDFQDIYAVVRAGVAVPDELWDLFSRKNPDRELPIAKAQAAHRLAAIEQRRPIEEVEPDHRQEAASLRAWVRESLVGKPFEPQLPKTEVEPLRSLEPLEFDQDIEL
jgi:hypothetical protein